MEKKKLYLYVATIIFFVLMPLSLWLAAFISPVYAKKTTPAIEKPINYSNPKISFKWIKVPFVKTRQAELLINGNQVDSFSITKRGIEFIPSNLPDGSHKANVRIKYGFPYYKEVKHEWTFEIDTTPPVLDLTFQDATNNGSTIVSAKNEILLSGKTETGSKVFIEKITETSTTVDINAAGNFSYDISLQKPTEELKLRAIDRAGNESVRNYSIKHDNKPPKIELVYPNQVAIGYPIRFKVNATDKESWINKVEFKFDEKSQGFETTNIKLAKTENNDFGKLIKLSDNQYGGTFHIYDAAGNKTLKTVSFEVNTTKIEVSRAKRKLFLYRNGRLAKSYNVAVGQLAFPTPGGSFKIINKRVNPSWINPNRPWSKQMPGRIPPGPDNPLGTRAMDLNVGAIRIHGTRNYGSIGRAASHGCIRMTIADSEELFRIVRVGTPVTIY